MPEEDAILALLRAQETAVARGDAAGAIADYATGSVIYDMPPPLKYSANPGQGIPALDEWFASWQDGVTTRIEDPTIIVSGDLAVVFGLSRMQGIKKGQGSLDAWNRRTVVLRRQDGRWAIIHEHSSYPMAMDGSGRALTDLKPDEA